MEDLGKKVVALEKKYNEPLCINGTTLAQGPLHMLRTHRNVCFGDLLWYYPAVGCSYFVSVPNFPWKLAREHFRELLTFSQVKKNQWVPLDQDGTKTCAQVLKQVNRVEVAYRNKLPSASLLRFISQLYKLCVEDHATCPLTDNAKWVYWRYTSAQHACNSSSEVTWTSSKLEKVCLDLSGLRVLKITGARVKQVIVCNSPLLKWIELDCPKLQHFRCSSGKNGLPRIIINNKRLTVTQALEQYSQFLPEYPRDRRYF